MQQPNNQTDQKNTETNKKGGSSLCPEKTICYENSKKMNTHCSACIKFCKCTIS